MGKIIPPRHCLDDTQEARKNTKSVRDHARHHPTALANACKMHIRYDMCFTLVSKSHFLVM